MLPFEFVVAGQPVSHQTNNRALLRVWRGRVRAATQGRWPVGQPPLDSPLKITVVYYYDGSTGRMDNDNLLKPIQDALIGLVYRDDNQITDSAVRRTSINGAFFVRGMPYILLEGFARGQEFVYLKVEAAPDHRELLR
jgi:hypothetical protein